MRPSKSNTYQRFNRPVEKDGLRAIEHAESVGVRRINLTVYVPNPAAVKLYESLQFEHCGVEPEAILIGDAYFDGYQMSRRSI